MRKEELKKFLMSPKEVSALDNQTKAEILCLHFIGYLNKPTGIGDELYERCAEAFNGNRGKFETETAAILKILYEEQGQIFGDV